MRLEFLEKFLQVRFRTFHKDFHTLCIVLNPPAQCMGLRQAVDERAESDALNHTANMNGAGARHNDDGVS